MTSTAPSASKLLTKLLVTTVLGLILLFGLLALAAGTWRWPQLWVLLIEVGVLNSAVHIWLLTYNPALLAERLGSMRQKSQTAWDKVFTAFGGLGMLGWFVSMGLDHRWHWSHVPMWLQVLGAVGVAISLIFTAFVFRANSFAAPVVKVQAARQHSIADTGPYAYVRHPMYTGTIPFLVGAPLLLSSWVGLAWAPFIVVALGARAVGEERLLTAELHGYPEYASRVRYRLVPYVW